MPSLPIRMGLAVRQVDVDITAASREYPASLPSIHIAYLSGWKPRLKRTDNLLQMYTPEEFDRLSPLARALEQNRAHAEALLALVRAGELTIDDAERTRLTRRALGILPTEEGERFVEIASCPETDPHYLTSNPGRLVSGIAEIEREAGLATALGYGFLLVAGVRSRTDLMKYGMRIEQLFERIVERPTVRSMLTKMGPGGLKELKHDAKSKLVRAVYDALWLERPNRVGTAFVLTQVIDGYLGLRPGAVGDVLGLAVIDTIILGKLNLAVRHLARRDHVYLEVTLSVRGVEHLDPVERRGEIPVRACLRVGIAELLLRAYERMARGYAERGQFGHGARIAQWMVGMKPDYARSYELLGLCRLGENDPRAALEAADKALELDRRLADAYLVQGNAYSAMSRWSEAIASYKQAIHYQLGYAEAYNNLGRALARNGEPARAVGAYKEAIRVRPGYAEAWFNLGTLFFETGDFGQAQMALEQAIKASPGFAAAHYNLGQVHYAQKDLPAALAAYRSAIKANPKHAGAWHNLGIVYRDLGQNEQAVEAIEKAVQLNPMLLR